MAAAVVATVLGAARAGAWWPASAAAGAAGTAWIARCGVRRDATTVWPAVAAVGAAYVVALLAGVDAVDTWAAGYAALLLLVAELAHAAAGVPEPGIADAASRVRYSRVAVAATLGGFGAAELLVAASSSGGSGGAQVTALGVAAAAGALGVLAAAARRASSDRT